MDHQTSDPSMPSDASIPIDSEVPITGFSVRYSSADVNPSTEVTLTRLFIEDVRGAEFQSELQILKDSQFQRLPNAYQSPKGQIRFFAYESQLAAILGVLNSGALLWLQTRGGRVSIIQGQKATTRTTWQESAHAIQLGPLTLPGGTARSGSPRRRSGH